MIQLATAPLLIEWLQASRRRPSSFIYLENAETNSKAPLAFAMGVATTHVSEIKLPT